jgi:predicted nucleic acid-binding protein
VSFVLDNSVALAWCFEDEQTPAVMALLDRLTETGAGAPLLWPLEALNGLLVAERRGRLDAAKRARLAGFLRELPITLDRDTADRVWDTTLGLAARFKLSVYDAAYLELAQRRRLPLATLDRELRDAAIASQVDVLGAPP